VIKAALDDISLAELTAPRALFPPPATRPPRGTMRAEDFEHA
jgi:hypothetical protein